MFFLLGRIAQSVMLCGILALAYAGGPLAQARLAAAAPAVPQRVVGDGTPASCTELALLKAVDDGGDILFACGGPHTFALTMPLTATLNAHIDGGGQITLTALGIHRMVHVAATSVMTIDNMTFASGNGGAIISYGDLTVRGSRFSGNATRGGGADRLGGAISAQGRLTVLDSIFERNAASVGGAIAMGMVGGRDKLHVARSIFRANGETSGTNRGGAIAVVSNGDATIIDSQFLSNQADMRGGALDLYGGVTISGSRFVDNRTNLHAGAIWNEAETTINHSEFVGNLVLARAGSEGQGMGGAIVTVAPLTVTASMLHGNSADLGGGMFAFSMSEDLNASMSVVATANQGDYYRLTIADTAFTNNTARQFGGALGMDALQFPFHASVRDSVFASNSANTGGGAVWVELAEAEIEASSIVSNSAGVAGGGVLVGWTDTVNARVVLTNTTIAGNSMGQTFNAGGVHVIGRASLSNVTLTDNTHGIHASLGAVTLLNVVLDNPGYANCLNPTGGLQSIGGNFSTDATCAPKLPNTGTSVALGALQRTDAGQYARHPLADSPLIDAGIVCPLRDQLGVLRGARCDSGAAEYVPAVPPPSPTPTPTPPPNLNRRVLLPLVVKP